nr:hypothetical protein [Tanacetum cinerariifolium]
MPHDSPLLRVQSLGSVMNNLKLNELTVLYTTLSKKDPFKQGRKIDDIDENPSISLLPDEGTSWIQKDSKIQGRTSADTEILLDQEEPTELVEDLGSGDKAEADSAHSIDWNDLIVLRYHALHNRSFSKAKVRKNTCTYLKNQGGYKQSYFKGMSYEDIRPIFEKVWDQIHVFVPMDSKIEKEKETVAKKRIGAKLDEESAKRQKLEGVTEEEATVEYEQEKEQLRLTLKIFHNDHSKVNYEPLFRKFPIMSWEYQLLEKIEAKDMKVCKLTRADESSSYHGNIQAFLRRLDRQDLNDLYMLFQERFQDLALEGHEVLRWKLHKNCRVHTLFMDGTLMEINMLVEKKYPLIKELLEKMLILQLEAEKESTMSFEFIKFIKSLLKE